MRTYKMAAAAAVAAVGANAQGAYGSSSAAPVSYTTVTYDTCPSVTESLVTITNGVTVTYCPLCDQSGSPPAPTGTSYTTVYTTTYLSMCSTGMVPATYTITESCEGPQPTWNTASDHIPPDFTVTTKMCSVCESTPVPVTITEPCGCKASEGMMMPSTQPAPMPTGGNGGSGGSGGSAASPGNGGSPTTGVCPGPQCMATGQGSVSPGSGSTMAGCPGPECQATGTSTSTSTDTATGSGSGCPGPQCKSTGTAATTPSGTLKPYTGAASSFGATGIASSIFVAVVAALAFGL